MKTSEEIEKEWDVLSDMYSDLETEMKLLGIKIKSKIAEWYEAKDRENEEILEINTP
jgi:hypothetical protein